MIIFKQNVQTLQFHLPAKKQQDQLCENKLKNNQILYKLFLFLNNFLIARTII